MNRSMVFFTTGKVIFVEAALLLLPLAVSLIYGEYKTVFAFLISIALAAGVGTLLSLFCKPKNKSFYAREGFAIVSLAWIALSLFGAIPFTLSGAIPSYVDAIFEMVSGFTTTGASILTEIESLGKGLLFWRSFSHWIGGMGVLVFVLALIPNMADRPIHLIRAEMPGPVIGKLLPKTKDTSKILYVLYIFITLTEVIFLLCGRVPLYDSLLLSFGTAGTGGFTFTNAGIGGYSPYVQWVITIFMLLFGINFTLYCLVILKRIKVAIKSEELWTYFSIFAASTLIITANIRYLYDSFGETIRHAAFQVSSIITTTGYSTTDFNLWPQLSRSIIFVLMLLGACAGSTAGGFKLSRVVMLAKLIKREFQKLLHPRSVRKIKFEGKTVEESTLYGLGVYLAIYASCLLVFFLLISLEPFDLEVNLSAVVSCFNNIGPALGIAGPMGNYSAFSDFSKIILSFAMLLGRLEIYPLLLTLTPSTWSKKQ